MPSRNISRQVTGSTIVTSSAQVDVLANYLSIPPAQLKLTTLFSSSTSGWTPKALHDLCDQQGATFTIVKTGEQFHGGYASVSWNSSGSYQSDPQAFLFRFRCASQQKIVTSHEKFGRTNVNNEVFGNAAYGPGFGYKHDFFSFGNGQQPFSDVQHGRQASFALPTTLYYDSSVRTTANSVLEVLKVGCTANVAEELDEPWQPFPWGAEVRLTCQVAVAYTPAMVANMLPTCSHAGCYTFTGQGFQV